MVSSWVSCLLFLRAPKSGITMSLPPMLMVMASFPLAPLWWTAGPPAVPRVWSQSVEIKMKNWKMCKIELWNEWEHYLAWLPSCLHDISGGTVCSGAGSAAMVHVSCLYLSLVLSCPGAGWCDDNDVFDDCINVTIDLQITGNYHLTHFIYWTNAWHPYSMFHNNVKHLLFSLSR